MSDTIFVRLSKNVAEATDFADLLDTYSETGDSDPVFEKIRPGPAALRRRQSQRLTNTLPQLDRVRVFPLKSQYDPDETVEEFNASEDVDLAWRESDEPLPSWSIEEPRWWQCRLLQGDLAAEGTLPGICTERAVYYHPASYGAGTYGEEVGRGTIEGYGLGGGGERQYFVYTAYGDQDDLHTHEFLAGKKVFFRSQHADLREESIYAPLPLIEEHLSWQDSGTTYHAVYFDADGDELIPYDYLGLRFFIAGSCKSQLWGASGGYGCVNGLAYGGPSYTPGLFHLRESYGITVGLGVEKCWGYGDERVNFGLKRDGTPLLLGIPDVGLDYRIRDFGSEEEDYADEWAKMVDGTHPSLRAPRESDGSLADNPWYGFYPPGSQGGHGTGTTACLLARADDEQSVSPASSALAMPFAVSSGGYPDPYITRTQALVWAADAGCDLTSGSFAGLAWQLQEALEYTRAFGIPIFHPHDNNYYKHGRCHPWVISVAWCDQRGVRGFRSTSYGENLDFVIPGDVSIGRTPYYSQQQGSNLTHDAWYGLAEDDHGQWLRTRKSSGQSDATPICASVGALLMARNPLYRPDDVKQGLRHSAVKEYVPGVLWDIFYGWGRPQADHALNAVIGVIENRHGEMTADPYGITENEGNAIDEDKTSYSDSRFEYGSSEYDAVSWHQFHPASFAGEPDRGWIRLWVAYKREDLGSGENWENYLIRFSYSTDEGESWSALGPDEFFEPAEEMTELFQDIVPGSQLFLTRVKLILKATDEADSDKRILVYDVWAEDGLGALETSLQRPTQATDSYGISENENYAFDGDDTTYAFTTLTPNPSPPVSGTYADAIVLKNFAKYPMVRGYETDEYPTLNLILRTFNFDQGHPTEKALMRLEYRPTGGGAWQLWRDWFTPAPDAPSGVTYENDPFILESYGDADLSGGNPNALEVRMSLNIPMDLTEPVYVALYDSYLELIHRSIRDLFHPTEYANPHGSFDDPTKTMDGDLFSSAIVDLGTVGADEVLLEWYGFRNPYARAADYPEDTRVGIAYTPTQGGKPRYGTVAADVSTDEGENWWTFAWPSGSAPNQRITKYAGLEDQGALAQDIEKLRFRLRTTGAFDPETDGVRIRINEVWADSRYVDRSRHMGTIQPYQFMWKSVNSEAIYLSWYRSETTLCDPVKEIGNVEIYRSEENWMTNPDLEAYEGFPHRIYAGYGQPGPTPGNHWVHIDYGVESQTLYYYTIFNIDKYGRRSVFTEAAKPYTYTPLVGTSWWRENIPDGPVDRGPAELS